MYLPLQRTAARALPRLGLGDWVGSLEGRVLAQVLLVEVTHVRLCMIVTKRVSKGGEGGGWANGLSRVRTTRRTTRAAYTTAA